MNKPQLNAILKRARTPEHSEEFWRDFSQRVVRGLNSERTTNFRPSQNVLPRMAWGFATVICIGAAFAIGHWRGQAEAKASPDVLANSKLVGETLAMFPNQVRAIVEEDGGLHLVLSDRGDVPVSTSIYVRICDGKHCSSLVTFSGQEIQVAGQEMTVLSDAQGGIILEGNKFVWSSTSRIYVNRNLKIEAKPL